MPSLDLDSWHWKGLTHTISDSQLEDGKTQSHSQGFLPLFLKYVLTTGKRVDPFFLFLLVCSQWYRGGERALYSEFSFFFFFFPYMKGFIVPPPQLTAGPGESSKRSRKREEWLLTYFQSGRLWLNRNTLIYERGSLLYFTSLMGLALSLVRLVWPILDLISCEPFGRHYKLTTKWLVVSFD